MNTENRAIYFVRRGEITLMSSVGKSIIISSGGYFGDDNMKCYDLEVTAQTTAWAKEDCLLGLLSLATFTKVFSKSPRISKIKWGDRYVSQVHNEVKYDELKRLQILGSGTFGTVWLVSRKPPKGVTRRKASMEFYALKIQNKRHAIKMGHVNGMIREKNIMDSVFSPSIIRLFNTYQDDTHTYMLLNLIHGGELSSVMKRLAESKSDMPQKYNGLCEQKAIFYAAGVLEGISYMHYQNIIYRDLKPENVMLDERGYPVLIDLGFGRLLLSQMK